MQSSGKILCGSVGCTNDIHLPTLGERDTYFLRICDCSLPSPICHRCQSIEMQRMQRKKHEFFNDLHSPKVCKSCGKNVDIMTIKKSEYPFSFYCFAKFQKNWYHYPKFAKMSSDWGEFANYFKSKSSDVTLNLVYWGNCLQVMKIFFFQRWFMSQMNFSKNLYLKSIRFATINNIVVSKPLRWKMQKYSLTRKLVCKLFGEANNTRLFKQSYLQKTGNVQLYQKVMHRMIRKFMAKDEEEYLFTI